MCGIAGIFTVRAGQAARHQALVKKMADALVHRGPDGSGSWANETGFAMSHRRLAIVDLSEAGGQPMISPSGRFVIAFNGEIYNHLALREELAREGGGTDWRGHSDTETLLACVDRWGFAATLRRAVGMFAIALWDSQETSLQLARDRFGEKPLYYGWTGHGDERAFVFGSELKALRAYPGFDNPLCRTALGQYMRHMYVPAPRSIYRHIYKLEPGCVLSLSQPLHQRDTDAPPRVGDSAIALSLSRWWSFEDMVVGALTRPIADETQAIDSLERQLDETLSLQAIADVPLGAFLSSGVDSSTIAALMQKNSMRRIRTFTVGFEESGYDESDAAAAIANHLGTDHTAFKVSSREALALIPALPQMYDEPFADSSQIPTHLVCKAARTQVAVALSGDAGDEMFAGYNRYLWGPDVWRRVSLLPFGARQGLSALMQRVPVGAWDTAGGLVNLALGHRRVARAGEKAHKLAASFQDARDLEGLYRNLVSEWRDPADVVRGHAPTEEALHPVPAAISDAAGMMMRDTLTYLPDDILCKVDRAAMAASLETRAPFLDHRVAELAWRFPQSLKLREGRGKWVLRQVLYRHVPAALIDRPKLGFSMPIGEWLRGPLRSWAEELLDESRLEREGFLIATPIRQRWKEHLEGRRDHAPALWTVLMFQSWLAAQSFPTQRQTYDSHSID